MLTYADLYGVSAKNPRERKCYYSVQSGTPWPMAKLYVDKVFHSANREAALEMLHNVRARFEAALGSEEWMSEDDRTAAQHKLSEMFFQVPYPTHAENKIPYAHVCPRMLTYAHVCGCRWRTPQTRRTR